jgi:thymidylate synthase
MVAQQCHLAPGNFVWTGGDCHIYRNHIEQVKLQLTREPYPLPRLHFSRHPASLFNYAVDDIELLNYQSHPHIKGEVAV